MEPGYPSAAEPTVDVTLLVGYPKQDKLEQVIRHGVELGCDHFIPFFSRYCVAAPKKEEQKNERYNRIAFEAAKQCGRGILPDVAPVSYTHLNRESLLGPRPARRKQSAADAGCRNPDSGIAKQ